MGTKFPPVTSCVAVAGQIYVRRCYIWSSDKIPVSVPHWQKRNSGRSYISCTNDVLKVLKAAQASVCGKLSKYHKLSGSFHIAMVCYSYPCYNKTYNWELNPLRPNSDLSQTSHCNIKGLSVSEVMRIENMITQVQFY